MSFSSKITINKLCEPIGEEGGYTHKQTIFYEYKCSSHTDATKRFIHNNYKVCHVKTRGEGKWVIFAVSFKEWESQTKNKPQMGR